MGPAGSIWVEDFILETETLKDKRPAHSLTYCALFVLERIEFYDILMDFKNESKLVRKASIKLAFRRAVLSTACARREGSMQGKFSGLTNYLAKNIVDPGKHNENETLLSDNHMMH